MSHALVIVWMGSVAAWSEHRADLDSWARSRIVTLAPVTSAVPTRAALHDEKTVAHVELELHEAAIEIEADELASARARLRGVESLLDAHPELPQSAFLRAEQLRIEAALVSLLEPDRAAALVSRAADLEGRRAATYGEKQLGIEKAEPVAPPALIRITGVRRTDDVYVNGVLRKPPVVPATGPAHVRVLRNGQLIAASWLTPPPNATSVPILTGDAPACSALDLEGVRVVKGHVVAPSGIGCADWIAARPAQNGGIEVARCRGSECGPLLPWRATFNAVLERPPKPAHEESRLPRILGWTLAGVALVAAGGFVAWQVGAFDSQEPRDSGFRFNGPGVPNRSE